MLERLSRGAVVVVRRVLERVSREPVLSVDVVRRGFLALMVLGWLALDEQQLAAVLVFVEGVFSWYIRTMVTPEVTVVEREQAANTAGRAEATAEIVELAASEPVKAAPAKRAAKRP